MGEITGETRQNATKKNIGKVEDKKINMRERTKAKEKKEEEEMENMQPEI